MQTRSTEYEVVWLIRRLFRAMGQAADQYLERHGVSAADRAVLEFLFPEQALSVPEIATRYQVSRQHVQVRVNALLDRGLLETRPNPRHKRSRLIALTDEGRRLFGVIRKTDAEMLEALFADIPREDVERTHRTLEAMYFHNLTQHKPPRRSQQRAGDHEQVA